MSDNTAEILALLKAQQEQIAALQEQVAAKGTRKAKPKTERKRPEGMPSDEASAWSKGNLFGVYVPDGYVNPDGSVVSRTAPPSLFDDVPVHKREKGNIGPDGLCVVVETRTYRPNPQKGWTRSKKDGGWNTYFPQRV